MKMDLYDMEDLPAPPTTTPETPLKNWRLKYQAGTLQKTDFTEFFQKESRKYFEFQYERESDAQKPSLKCMYKETEAKLAIIDTLLEFMLGDNPQTVLEKLRQEGNTASVCGRVFKNGEPTYSCRECGMDPTCVLCVNCFKKSAHRYHKYKMSTSGGGGCCDCGDEEAWKKDHYCEDHLRASETPTSSTIITDVMKERCEIAFTAVLSFCVNYLEIESNASLECLDGQSGQNGENDENCYCTVLYNDESHTFDQVIQTLTKIIKCRLKDAQEIVTNIDREGRAVVKCDSFEECNQLKDSIERQSTSTSATLRPHQSLRVSVLHTHALACQQFALQLLTWFQDFLTRHRMFREIFARLIMDKKAPYCIRHILENDVSLWKVARTCWHRLLISGMLMEYENKMTLACEFSRHYATIVQDFIRDDHEHSYSIVSLSVQLFTVPSIAHYLIGNEGIFFKLLHTFYHEAVEKFIQNKVLHFSKNMSTLGYFKRAAYILYDLRYILSFKPDVWTDQLREGFLEGCKVLLKLLNVMQGMESITRQTGQHMDYEPEWECAFNLHIKLASTLTLVLEWSATDRDVLVKLYQMVMRYLITNPFILNSVKMEERNFAGHVANCIIYDVDSKPVSIHLPLSRFFAGVYINLGIYDLNYDNTPTGTKRTPTELIEPVLCAQAMIAQVYSGMWRRNGYSLLHQLYFYRNVRCRGEMLDRDIIGLQIGAALIESNQYLIHVLNKFNLIEWMKDDYQKLYISTTDDHFVRPMSMVDEFLELLIVIIGERCMPGVAEVTEEDRVKKELIQCLCIRPHSHSELSRCLPDNYNDNLLEEVIDAVAVFKKPTRPEVKGVYELREELYDSYNMYFYHYTKEEKSKSEEMQRERRKIKGQLVCCPPPQLPKLTKEFISIANLLQCDAMLTIMRAILSRASVLEVDGFSESHLQKILFLIGFGIQEELTGNYPFLTFGINAISNKIPSILDDLSRNPKVESQRDLILWVIRKFKELERKHEKVTDGDPQPTDDAMFKNIEQPTHTECLNSAEQDMKEKKERARFAAERREKIMAQMQSAQKKFMTCNAELFEDVDDNKTMDMSKMDWQAEEGAVAYKSVACLGVDRRLPQLSEENFKCILCFEDCSPSIDGATLVYSAFVQKSRVLPPESKQPYSLHASTCGHVMHGFCWQEYYNNEESKEQRRPNRSRLPFLSTTQSTDFHCPYCRCLSNTVLPLTPPLAKYSMPRVSHAGDKIIPIDTWMEVVRAFHEGLYKILAMEDRDHWCYGLPSMESLLQSTNLSVDSHQFDEIAQLIDAPTMTSDWSHYLQHYIKTSCQYAPAAAAGNPMDGTMWLWKSCTYTIKSLEVYLRAVNKPFKDEMSMRHVCCLKGLIRAGCFCATNLNMQDFKSLIQPIADLLDMVFKQKGASVLEWDCFNMMATMVFVLPNLLYSIKSKKSVVSNGSIMDQYALQLFYMANLVKAIVLFEAPPSNDNAMDIDVNELDPHLRGMPENIQENIATFYRKYNIAARRQTKKSDNDMGDQTYENIECNMHTIAALFDHIKVEMCEYLRCSCLLFHFITDVDFPHEGCETFEQMCKYLGLPTHFNSFFDNTSAYPAIMEMFATHHDIVYYNLDTNLKHNGEAYAIVPCTRDVPRLVALPEDYSDLINSVTDFVCPNNEREEMKSPTMCLTCGKIVCGQSYCCQPELHGRTVGACTYHSYFCGAEIGVFLRIRDCQIVYLGLNKGCFVLPPYLDEYGETDQGLRRGNPLQLCRERYEKIHLTWLNNGLHEEMARINDNTTVTVTQWHHM